METVFITNTDHDVVAVVNDQNHVVSAWKATPKIIAAYIAAGNRADTLNSDDNFGPAESLPYINDYGFEAGRDGEIDDEDRAAFWRKSPPDDAGFVVYNDVAIWGVGQSENEAWLETAKTGCIFGENGKELPSIKEDGNLDIEAMEASGFKVAPATQALLRSVEERGGAISWGTIKGTKCTNEEEAFYAG